MLMVFAAGTDGEDGELGLSPEPPQPAQAIHRTTSRSRADKYIHMLLFPRWGGWCKRDTRDVLRLARRKSALVVGGVTCAVSRYEVGPSGVG